MKTACHQFKTPEALQAEPFRPSGKLQMWGCNVCGEKRQYGEGQPASGISYDPLIHCRYCNRPTRHLYIGIVQEEA